MRFDRTNRNHVAGLFTPRERVRFKSTPTAPPPANPTTVAGAQTTSNVDTAVANAELGNVNQFGPLGSTTSQQTGGQMVDGNFVPSFTQTTSLNPTLQSILSGTETNANNLVPLQGQIAQGQAQNEANLLPAQGAIQQGAAQTAESLIPVGQQLAGQAAGSLTTPLNFSGANQNIIQGGPQALYQPVTSQVFQGEQSLLAPTMQQQQTQLQDQLSAQGIPLGSQAYSNAETQLGTQQNQLLSAAAGNAAGIGANTSGNMFNLALLGQNQQNQQQVLGQQNPLQNLSQIYGSGVAY